MSATGEPVPAAPASASNGLGMEGMESAPAAPRSPAPATPLPGSESPSMSGSPSHARHAYQRKSSNEALVCVDCRTTETPLWRRSEQGGLLCNACGLYWKVHGCTRPVKLKTAVPMRRRPKTSTPKAKYRSVNGVQTFSFSVAPFPFSMSQQHMQGPAILSPAIEGGMLSPQMSKLGGGPSSPAPSPMQRPMQSSGFPMLTPEAKHLPGPPPSSENEVFFNGRVHEIGDCVALNAGPTSDASVRREYFAVIRGFLPRNGDDSDRQFLVTWLLPKRQQQSMDANLALKATDFQLGPEEHRPQPMSAITRSLKFKKRFTPANVAAVARSPKSSPKPSPRSPAVQRLGSPLASPVMARGYPPSEGNHPTMMQGVESTAYANGAGAGAAPEPQPSPTVSAAAAAAAAARERGKNSLLVDLPSGPRRATRDELDAATALFSIMQPTS